MGVEGRHRFNLAWFKVHTERKLRLLNGKKLARALGSRDPRPTLGAGATAPSGVAR